MSRRRCSGKLFHMWGPAAPKLRSPKLLRVRGTRHVLAAAERSRRRSLSVTSWMSSAMYAGVCPASDWCTRHATLYSTRWRTGSQCSWRSTGVMCSFTYISKMMMMLKMIMTYLVLKMSRPTIIIFDGSTNIGIYLPLSAVPSTAAPEQCPWNCLVLIISRATLTGCSMPNMRSYSNS